MIGGNGFLGTHVQNELKKHGGYEVFAPSKKEANWLTREGIEEIKFKPDIIIHILAIYGGLPFCMNNRVKMAVDNLEINGNVYRYIANKKPKRIITIGSGCEYPGYKSGILTEDQLGDGKLHQSVAHYGYSKLMQLQACEAMREEFGTEYEHIVLANMYGPGDLFDFDRSHVVGALIKKFIDAKGKKQPVRLLGTGTAVRDLIYVKDVAELVVKLIALEKSTNQPLNASTGVGTSIKDLAEIISKEIEFDQSIIWGDESEDGALLKILSVDRIKKVLGWVPNTDLKDGIKETIDWLNSK